MIVPQRRPIGFSSSGSAKQLSRSHSWPGVPYEGQRHAGRVPPVSAQVKVADLTVLKGCLASRDRMHDDKRACVSACLCHPWAAPGPHVTVLQAAPGLAATSLQATCFLELHLTSVYGRVNLVAAA
jgi:hypothetical protein